jgi:serine/threonine protein kinase
MSSDAESRLSGQELFLRMLDSADPDAVLSMEPDGAVRAHAKELWLNHVRAEKDSFLEQPPELVRQLHHPPDAARSWQPGARLADRFVVLEFLGEGGMGEVYLAHDDRLHDRVALKTIRKELLDVPELRERLSAEVQNARQVTHPHVCRIYDIYDDTGTSFFAMEYLPGQTLSAVLESGQLTPRQARIVALQLAEALYAAHRKNILHRDFKPGNVILTRTEPEPYAVITDFGLARAAGEADTRNIYSVRGGTPQFMAPEVLTGGPATIQSDLYAYGSVLARIQPGSSLVPKLTAEDPASRPKSMLPVIEALKSGGPAARWTRRAWVLGLGTAFGGAIYWRRNEPKVPLGSPQRVILNGLRGTLRPASTLLAIHDLLELALEQSPLLHIFPDQTLRAALRRRGLPPELPARIEHLRDIATHEGTRVIIDGEVRHSSSGLAVDLDLFVDAGREAVYRISQSVDDARQLARLAELTALELRKQFGESAGSIRNSYSPLERATSAIPEAVEYYFAAVQAYEQTRVEAAIALLDKAIALDPQFALAHFYRGLALSALFRTKPGFEACERAFQLRARTTPREQAWIESQYYNLAGDRLRALDAYKKNAFLYPDDGIFQRQLAYGYARLGQLDEALRCSRRAVELDPFSIINRSELIVNLAEAMRYDESLAAYDDYIAQDLGGPVPKWGAGLAHLGKREYAPAQRLFEELGRSPEYSRWAAQLSTIAPILDGDLVWAAFRLQGDLALDLAAGEEFRVLERRMWLGWTDFYRDNRDGALLATRDLVCSEPLPNFIFAWRAAGRLAAALGDEFVYRAALAGLRQIESRYPSTYLSASIAGMSADWALHTNDMAASEKAVIESTGLFPDPQNLLTAAHYFRAIGNYEWELRQLRELETAHGRILKHEWPGWIPLHWFELARCLADLGRTQEARPYHLLAQQSWGRQLRGSKIGEAIRALSSQMETNTRKGASTP